MRPLNTSLQVAVQIVSGVLFVGTMMAVMIFLPVMFLRPGRQQNGVSEKATGVVRKPAMNSLPSVITMMAPTA